MRNEGSIKRIATVLLANASSRNGLTLDEISAQTELDRSTVWRIVSKQPGFAKSIEPVWPYGYYYSHTLAAAKLTRDAVHAARNDPNGEVVIKTVLGNAIIKAAELDVTAGNNPTQYINSLSMLGGILDAAVANNPVTAGARFVNDPELQAEWFKNFVQLINACRQVYVHGTNLLSSDEFQQQDFWKIFITTN